MVGWSTDIDIVHRVIDKNHQPATGELVISWGQATVDLVISGCFKKFWILLQCPDCARQWMAMGTPFPTYIMNRPMGPNRMSTASSTPSKMQQMDHFT